MIKLINHTVHTISVCEKW